MRKILKRITAFALSVLLICTSGVTDLLNSTASVTAKAATTAFVDGEKVVTEALRLLGTPYVWGGTSTSGMDCSGFVYYLLTKKFNVNANTVPRDTASWSNAISNGTLALKDNNGNTISITIKTYNGRYPTASEVAPGTVILQDGHMSICAGTFEGNTGTTPEFGTHFRLNTMLSVRNTLLSKYGSAISNLSALLEVSDTSNPNFYMHGSYCEPSTYNNIWRIEAIGGSSNTPSNPGLGISLSNSKKNKYGAETAIATITFDEKPTKGQMYFTKTGAYTQDAVKGATYAVYPSTMSNTDVQKRGTANRITTFTTGSDGSATVSLDAGVYKAIEITAPSGFELSDKVYTVNVITNTTTTQSVTDDEKPFSLRLKKTDAATGKTLTGAEFTVYARQEKSGSLPSGWYESPSFYWKPIGRMAYNASTGYYEAKNLYPVEHTSNYLVRETKAPDGYVLDSRWSWEVKVLAPATSYSGSLQRVNFGGAGTYQGKSGSAATTVENTPEPITLRLQKTDAATGALLSGATFTVYEKTAKLSSLPEGWKETNAWYWKPVKDFTYDSTTGYYTAGGLQPNADNDGCYRIYEAAAPAGFGADTDWVWEVRAMNADVAYTGGMTRANYGEVTTYQAAGGSNAVVNTPETISLKIRKLDSTTGAGLYGAAFTAYEKQPVTGTLPLDWKEADGSYWKPVNTLTYSGNGEYRIDGLQATATNQGIFRVYETTAPAGYTADSSWYWEVQATAPGSAYTGSATAVHYGTTASYRAADGTNGLNNTPQPFGVSIDKRDADTMAVLSGVTFTVYERQAATGSLPEGGLSADGYSWKPYATLAFNASTQKYDTVVLTNGTTASGLQPTKANGGHFRIYETATQDATYVPYDGFWEVAGASTSRMGDDGIQYIKYGTAGTYGEYTDSPYLLNHTDNTSYTVKKVWDDGNNRDGIRPASVTVTLKAALQDGTPVDLAALAGAGTAAVAAQAESVQETTVEAAVPGSSTEETAAPEGTSAGETTAETSAEAETTAETAAGPFTVVLSSANSWQHTFTDLPVRTADGKTIIYTLVEENVPAGYTLTVRKSGTTITAVNTHNPETVEAPARKVWADVYNKDGIRPSSITVRLYANGTEINSAVLDSSNSWKYTFTTDADGNPLYKNDKGSAITYTISEDAVAGYDTAITGNAADGYTVTNTHIPYTSVRVTKAWEDYSNAAGTRPDAVTVRLYADGTEVNAAQVTAAQNWTCTFTTNSAGNRLEKFHSDGTPVSYTISEDAVAGYNAPAITGSAAAGYTITNTYEEYIGIPVSKAWDDCSDGAGLRPEEIAVRLDADGTGIVAARLNESNNWQHTFTVDVNGKYLPKYHADGTPVVYTIEEVELNDGDLDAYTISYAGSAETGFTITNTHRGYVQVPVEKVWDDKNNGANLRPDSITVRLYADGTEINAVQVTEDSSGSWAYTFTTDKDGNRLNKYAANGAAIRYTVNEDQIEGYSADIAEKNFTQAADTTDTADTAAIPKDGAVETATGFVITNTYREYTEVSVTKAWNDAGDRDGIRPDSITVYLFADGEIVNTAAVSADDAGSWNHTFTTDADGNQLDKYAADGHLVAYTISENILEGYTAKVLETDTDNAYILVNSHAPKTTEVKVNKTWNDNGLDEANRPETITVHLYADDVEVNSAEISADADWTYTFTETSTGSPLYRYRDGGVEIAYTVKEDVPEGWMADVTDITSEASTGIEMEVINTPTVLKVSKQDITTGAEVPGAALEIYAADEEGNRTGGALYSWVSTDTPHVISAIPAGDYVLVEALAPEADGYTKASDVNFTIEETGEVQGVVMKDDYTKVLISKTDMTTGEEIPGAELTITDADGNVVAEWTTDGTPHRIDYLAPGEYTLTEVSAPEEDGYVLAESVTFTVEATGEIQKVEMKDDYTKVEIRKTDFVTGEEIAGAKLTLTDADGITVAEWVTDGTPYRIDYLAPGEYTLTEIAAPDGYEIAESITFTVEATGEIQKIEMKDKPVEDIPETPILGIEDTFDPYISLLLAFAVGLFVFGVMLYLKCKSEKLD